MHSHLTSGVKSKRNINANASSPSLQQHSAYVLCVYATHSFIFQWQSIARAGHCARFQWDVSDVESVDMTERRAYDIDFTIIRLWLSMTVWIHAFRVDWMLLFGNFGPFKDVLFESNFVKRKPWILNRWTDFNFQNKSKILWKHIGIERKTRSIEFDCIIHTIEFRTFRYSGIITSINLIAGFSKRQTNMEIPLKHFNEF